MAASPSRPLPRVERRPLAGLRVRFAGRTDVGLRRRRNEDAHLILAPHGLAAVADGMGGRPLGHVASELAMRALVDAFCQRPEDLRDVAGDPEPLWTEDERRLVEALKLANRRVHEAATELMGQAGAMGTTCVAALFAQDGQSVAIAHAGDSRCYRIRDGRITLLTRDHSLASMLERHAAWLDPSAVMAPRHVLTRALGLQPSVLIDVTSEETAEGDHYLLCTDGVWSALAPAAITEVIVRAVRGESSLDDACDQLVEKANQAGGADNSTVVLARVERPVEIRRQSGAALRATHEHESEKDAALDWD